MIKKLLYSAIALVMFTCGSIGSMHFDVFKKKTPNVEPQLQKYFDRLDSIYEANNIKIDYKKINNIYVVDSLPESSSYNKSFIEGMYDKETKNIYINTNQIQASLFNKYDDIILVIMAHEVAHSQGIGHTLDQYSLMYPSSSFTLYLLFHYRVDDLMVQIYLDDIPRI